MRRLGASDSGPVPFFERDRAETFAESDVSVVRNGTRVADGSIELDLVSSTQSVVSGGASGSQTEPSGVVINPNQYVTEINGTAAPECDANRAFIKRRSDGEILDTASVISSFSLTNIGLSPGTDYVVALDGDGGSYTEQYDNDFSAYPYQNSTFDIATGWFRGGPDGGRAGNIGEITVSGPEQSGNAVVEWPQPADVYRWDAATFQTPSDADGVDVFIEESTDGGSTWTEIQGPIGRGDQIEADPGSRVRFRVELARSDTSNNPTLDAIYRRWVV